MPAGIPKRECVRKFDKSLAEIQRMTDREKEEFLRASRNYEGGSGWQPLEAALFRLALTKYGCGNWDTCSYFLPHHNTAQFNTFAQKLFGQQSLAPFSGLKLDPYEGYKENLQKHQLRKNGVVVHEGAPLTSVAKKALKESWAEREHDIDFENIVLPVVEDRSRNYTKLFSQMLEMESRILEELEERNLASETLWNYEDDLIFEDFTDNTPLEEHFPKITEWDLDLELQAMKGQDNLWPLIRFVEDDDWYAADQFLTINWVSGRCAMDLKDVGQCADNSVYIPPSASVTNQQRKKRKIIAQDNEESKEADNDNEEEEEMANENEDMDEEMPMDEESNIPSDKTVSQWSCEELCDYLVTQDLNTSIVEGCRRHKIDGASVVNLDESILQDIGALDHEREWSSAVFSAIMKYKYSG